MNGCVPPGATIIEAGDRESRPTATVALAVAEVSATLAAVMVCAPVFDGAVYNPVALIEPLVVFPPATPSTDHVTAVFVLFATVALNCAVPPASTLTDDWFSDTLTPAGLGVDEPVPPQPLSTRTIAKLKQP